MIESGVALSTIVYGSLQGAGIGGAFLVVRWIANFTTKRIDKREAHADAGMEQLVEGLKEEIGRLSGECRELRSAVAAHGRELDECRKKHAESEAEVMKLKAMMQGYGDARNKIQTDLAGDKLLDKK